MRDLGECPRWPREWYDVYCETSLSNDKLAHFVVAAGVGSDPSVELKQYITSPAVRVQANAENSTEQKTIGDMLGVLDLCNVTMVRLTHSEVQHLERIGKNETFFRQYADLEPIVDS